MNSELTKPFLDGMPKVKGVRWSNKLCYSLNNEELPGWLKSWVFESTSDLFLFWGIFLTHLNTLGFNNKLDTELPSVKENELRWIYKATLRLLKAESEWAK